jgi:hypothetical protein
VISQNYQVLLEKNREILNQVKSKAKGVSFARLITILTLVFCAYSFFKSYSAVFAVLSLLLLVGFIVLVKWYSKLSSQRKIAQALVEINENEIGFLENKIIPFPDGREFIDPTHAYSYDLDFFGEKSLFHVLNRTETFVGSQTLATKLQTLQSEATILKNQAAIEELAAKIEWRQEITAFAKVTDDSKEVFKNLESWTKTDKTILPQFLNIVSYVMPVITIGLTVYNTVFDAGLGNYCLILFLINLGIFSRQLKTIKKELISSTKIDRTLRSYSLILERIETEEFNAEALNELKNRLNNSTKSASQEIKKLSQLFDQLESILNPFGAILFNGFLLFHIHTLRGFRQWKNDNAANIIDWLKVMGEMEALNSLANFRYNNPDFSFPALNSNYEITFEGLGHPLLSKSQRVTSDIAFVKEKFIILTGSNMSGKSTFLRSLGVNMVLAGIGAPVCAAKANIHPIPVYVSMRVSDSLNDNESFFFAEVKRLKEVMDAADKKISFVLLDEILRGTNSDDKRTGTVEVVKKILSKNAIGAIATHDLKVCDTTADYPDQLTNKCFEVEIVNDELYFDYKLREGVCKNKSATFLMEKMGVI